MATMNANNFNSARARGFLATALAAAVVSYPATFNEDPLFTPRTVEPTSDFVPASTPAKVPVGPVAQAPRTLFSAAPYSSGRRSPFADPNSNWLFHNPFCRLYANRSLESGRMMGEIAKADASKGLFGLGFLLTLGTLVKGVKDRKKLGVIVQAWRDQRQKARDKNQQTAIIEELKAEEAAQAEINKLSFEERVEKLTKRVNSEDFANTPPQQRAARMTQLLIDTNAWLGLTDDEKQKINVYFGTHRAELKAEHRQAIDSVPDIEEFNKAMASAKNRAETLASSSRLMSIHKQALEAERKVLIKYILASMRYRQVDRSWLQNSSVLENILQLNDLLAQIYNHRTSSSEDDNWKEIISALKRVFSEFKAAVISSPVVIDFQDDEAIPGPAAQGSDSRHSGDPNDHDPWAMSGEDRTVEVGLNGDRIGGEPGTLEMPVGTEASVSPEVVADLAGINQPASGELPADDWDIDAGTDVIKIDLSDATATTPVVAPIAPAATADVDDEEVTVKIHVSAVGGANVGADADGEGENHKQGSNDTQNFGSFPEKFKQRIKIWSKNDLKNPVIQKFIATEATFLLKELRKYFEERVSAWSKMNLTDPVVQKLLKAETSSLLEIYNKLSLASSIIKNDPDHEFGAQIVNIPHKLKTFQQEALKFARDFDSISEVNRDILTEYYITELAQFKSTDDNQNSFTTGLKNWLELKRFTARFKQLSGKQKMTVGKNFFIGFNKRVEKLKQNEVFYKFIKNDLGMLIFLEESLAVFSIIPSFMDWESEMKSIVENYFKRKITRRSSEARRSIAKLKALEVRMVQAATAYQWHTYLFNSSHPESFSGLEDHYAGYKLRVQKLIKTFQDLVEHRRRAKPKASLAIQSPA